MHILDYYKPMFHYLLDGFLGKNDPGAIIDNVTTFLYDYNIYNFYNYNEKTNLKIINIDEIKSNLNNLDNSILTLGLDSHITSLLFYIIDNDLFILSINSGLGINNHKKYNKNNNILYSPFFCVKIKQYKSTKRSNNDTTKSNSSKRSKLNLKQTKSESKSESGKIEYNTLLPSYEKHDYNTQLPSYAKHDYNTLLPSYAKHDYNTGVLEKIIKFSQLYQEIENYKFNHNQEIIEKIIDYATELNLDEILSFINSDDKDDIIDNINNYTKNNFYNLFINYLTNNLNLKDSTDEFNNKLLDKINKDKNKENITNLKNINYFNNNTTYQNLNKRLYLKNRLYLLNNSRETEPQTNNFNLYIYSQEDGSCTFYSLYWAILINSLYNYDYNHYTKMITDFETKMVKICNKHFIPFLQNKEEYYNYPTISTILNKLSNLNVIDKTIFNNYLDTYLYENITLSVYTSDKCKYCTNDLYNKIYEYSDIYSILLQPHKIDSNDEFNTDIFLNIFVYFLKNMDDANSIFNIKDYKDTDFINTRNNKTINMIIGHIKYYMDKLKNYKSEEYLNIQTIQYYYIAKSIINFHIKYLNVNEDIKHTIIKFCHFIHKFKLFYMVFLFYIYYKLSDNIKRDEDLYVIETYFLELNIDDRNNIITSILNKITNNTLDKFDKTKIIRYNIYAIYRFYKNLFNKNFYLDGFTINFNFPPPTKYNIIELKLMQYPLKQLESITQFLYDNPRYLYNDFNNNYLFNKNYFIETNIIEILGKNEYKNKLDKYYRDLFYNAIKQNKTDEIYYFGRKILLLNYYKLLSNPYDFRKNSISKDKEKKLINNLINEASKSNFSEFKLENYDVNTILIENDYEPENFKINDGFNYEASNNFDCLFNTDNAYTLINTEDNNLYIFYENYHLIIHLDKINNQEQEYSITKIEICHGRIKYPVLKREDIKHWFKYFIPSACLSLIYEKDGQYNVLCVASKFNNSEYYKLFGPLILSNTPDIIFNYRVDLSNLLTISIDKDSDELNKLSYFIKNYGVNNLNYIYLKEWDEKGIQKINKNDFNLLCYFNSNNWYDYHEKYYNEDTNLIQFIQKKYSNNSKNIEMDDININLNFDIGNFNKIVNSQDLIKLKNYSEFEPVITDDELVASFNNLNFKLSSCSIDNISKIISIITKFNLHIKLKINQLYNKINTYIINNIPLLDLINSQDNIINYTYLNNIYNISKDILSKPSINNELFCSKLKTYINFNLRKNKFIYIFEYLFEFILGINVYDEQYYRYTNIINEHDPDNNDYNFITNKTYNPNYFEPKKGISLYRILKGGGYKNYPLHHIMMGKGKSSVLTPLLSLYFCLIKNKKVYIIVPPHLVNQTNKTFNNIIKIFELEKQIFIKSDEDIKNDYLREKSSKKEDKYNENLIFLIDEFDTILDPLKSEFNLTKPEFKKKIDGNQLIININEIIKNFFISNKDRLTKNDIAVYTELKNPDLIVSEINNVLLNINDNKLKYNINWGIHPDKGYAIPYMNKDTPSLNSNFNSIFLTLVLTYYYYYIILYRTGKLIFNENFVNTIINYNFKNVIEERINRVLPDSIKLLCDELNKESYVNKKYILETLITTIIESIEISKHQYNISFIDIINIPKVYKIGYSGTLNIELPEEINNSDKFTKDKITGDLDEKFNVYYSLLVNDVLIATKDAEIELNKDSMIFINNFVDMINYDAIIDTAGLFRYEPNESIAKLLHNKLHKRPIIYLNNNDEILVLNADENQKYDSNKIYDNPFFYYSQKHTVGIDIKQDNYPNLKGLCIIDKFNTYTEVAQSVFRLRKLNQGHTIQLFIINHISISKGIIDFLLENDNKNKKLKIPKLSLQTIKANIRTELDFKNIEKYKEKVKYFFDEDDYNNITNKHEILEDIFNKQDLVVSGDDYDMIYGETSNNINTQINIQEKLIKLINHPNKDDNNLNLKNLVYNVNSLSYTTTKDTSIQSVQNNSTQNKDFKKNDLFGIKLSIHSHNYQFKEKKKVNYIVINDDNNILQYNLSILTKLKHKDKTNYFTTLLLVVEKQQNKQIITIIQSTDVYLYINNERYTFLNCSGYKLNQNIIDITNHTLLKKYITNYYNHSYDKCLKLFRHKIFKYIFYILVKINGCNKVSSNHNINNFLENKTLDISFLNLYTNTNNYGPSIYINQYSIDDIKKQY